MNIKKLKKLTTALFAECLDCDAKRFYECLGLAGNTGLFPDIYESPDNISSLYQPALSVQFAIVDNTKPDPMEMDKAYEISVERLNMNCISELTVLVVGMDENASINPKIDEYLKNKSNEMKEKNIQIGLRWRNLDDLLAWIQYVYDEPTGREDNVSAAMDNVNAVYQGNVAEIFDKLEDGSYFK